MIEETAERSPPTEYLFKRYEDKNTKVGTRDIDVRNYAKYLLREGKDIEKRELLGCLKDQIKLQYKINKPSLNVLTYLFFSQALIFSKHPSISSRIS